MADFINEDAAATGRDRANENQLPYGRSSKLLEAKYYTTSEKEPISDNIPACMIKCKSVFKCQICPRIVCLNEETMRAHVNSKVREFAGVVSPYDEMNIDNYLFKILHNLWFKLLKKLFICVIALTYRKIICFICMLYT